MTSSRTRLVTCRTRAITHCASQQLPATRNWAPLPDPEATRQHVAAKQGRYHSFKKNKSGDELKQHKANSGRGSRQLRITKLHVANMRERRVGLRTSVPTPTRTDLEVYRAYVPSPPASCERAGMARVMAGLRTQYRGSASAASTACRQCMDGVDASARASGNLPPRPHRASV